LHTVQLVCRVWQVGSARTVVAGGLECSEVHSHRVSQASLPKY
jgi:hypothetical protein